MSSPYGGLKLQDALHQSSIPDPQARCAIMVLSNAIKTQYDEEILPSSGKTFFADSPEATKIWWQWMEQKMAQPPSSLQSDHKLMEMNLYRLSVAPPPFEGADTSEVTATKKETLNDSELQAPPNSVSTPARRHTLRFWRNRPNNNDGEKPSSSAQQPKTLWLLLHSDIVNNAFNPSQAMRSPGDNYYPDSWTLAAEGYSPQQGGAYGGYPPPQQYGNWSGYPPQQQIGAYGNHAPPQQHYGNRSWGVPYGQNPWGYYPPPPQRSGGYGIEGPYSVYQPYPTSPAPGVNPLPYPDDIQSPSADMSLPEQHGGTDADTYVSHWRTENKNASPQPQQQEPMELP
ncbi:MAG: hypothetical protein ABW189_08805 [Rickettsiales bacterium]